MGGSTVLRGPGGWGVGPNTVTQEQAKTSPPQPTHLQYFFRCVRQTPSFSQAIPMGRWNSFSTAARVCGGGQVGGRRLPLPPPATSRPL